MKVDFVCPKCGAPLHRITTEVEGRLVVEQKCSKCAFISLARFDMPAEVEALLQ